MLLKKYKHVVDYKPYSDFAWDEFLRSANFEKVNLIYDENGSGKTALVDVIKEVLGCQAFKPSKPSRVELEFNSGLMISGSYS